MFKTKLLSVRIPNEVCEKIDAIAHRDYSLNRHWLIVQVIQAIFMNIAPQELRKLLVWHPYSKNRLVITIEETPNENTIEV